MQSIEVTIQGITPLIINRFHEEAQAEATSGIHSREGRLAPENDAYTRLYLLKGEPYFPAENLRQAIITAAGRHKIGRRTATSDVAAAVFITPFAMPLSGEWHTDSRPVVIPATRGRLLRHRPMFDEWSVHFTLQLDERLIDPKLIRRVVDDAGSYVGVGDFRPARKGPYGRFMVTSWTAA